MFVVTWIRALILILDATGSNNVSSHWVGAHKGTLWMSTPSRILRNWYIQLNIIKPHLKTYLFCSAFSSLNVSLLTQAIECISVTLICVFINLLMYSFLHYCCHSSTNVLIHISLHLLLCSLLLMCILFYSNLLMCFLLSSLVYCCVHSLY